MAREITMPKLSDTMEEGKVLRWLKQEGDQVERGEVIAEIETDKADMEMEAFDSGVLLAIKVPAGGSAPVGEVIAYVGQPGERVGDGAPAPRADKARPAKDVKPAGGAKKAGKAERAPGKGEKARVEAEPREARSGDDGRGVEGERDEETAAAESEEEGERDEETAAPESEREAAAVDSAAEVAGPHADIAELIEPAETGEEEEGEEGSARQRPGGRRTASVPSMAPSRAREERELRERTPSKGLNDRLPSRDGPDQRFPRVKISPVARRLAAERGLDVSRLRGSGPEGRIVRSDVERALAAAAPASSGTIGPAAPARAPAPPAEVPVERGVLGTDLAHSKMRRAVAARMADSKRTVPHFYTTVAIRMDEALRLKEALAARYPETPVSVTHLLLRACALAIERTPRVNGVFEEDRIRIPAAIHLGLAVAVPDGLVVAVLHDCAGKPLPELARAARELVDRVRRGKPAQDDFQGATFTLSNLGGFSVEQFAAIVVPPQSAILAAGSVADEAVVEGGSVVAGKVLRVTLSADHRVIDGVVAAAFLDDLKRLLENPLTLVV